MLLSHENEMKQNLKINKRAKLCEFIFLVCNSRDPRIKADQ